MHEAQHRLRQNSAHQPHFGNRSNIVMGHARIPQHVDQIRRGVGFHRIEHLARKLLDEETGGAPRGVRAVENDGFVRRKRANYSLSVGIDVQLKGPPKRFVKTIKRQAALRLGSPLGAAGTGQIGLAGRIAIEKWAAPGRNVAFLRQPYKHDRNVTQARGFCSFPRVQKVTRGT
jgi:hypothetical protein